MSAENRSSVCYIGTPTRDLVFTPKLLENMLRKEFNLTGSLMSYSAPFPGKEWTLTAHYFSTGALRFDSSLIFKRLPLKDLQVDYLDLYLVHWPFPNVHQPGVDVNSRDNNASPIYKKAL
jgi:L-iditol 2-dehydrogenase